MFVCRDGFLEWYQIHRSRRTPSWLVMLLGFKRDALARQWNAMQQDLIADGDSLASARAVSGILAEAFQFGEMLGVGKAA